jgi:hypothetical protein
MLQQPHNAASRRAVITTPPRRLLTLIVSLALGAYCSTTFAVLSGMNGSVLISGNAPAYKKGIYKERPAVGLAALWRSDLISGGEMVCSAWVRGLAGSLPEVR